VSQGKPEITCSSAFTTHYLPIFCSLESLAGLQIEDLTEADLKAYNGVPDLDEAGSGDEEVVVQRAEGPKKRKLFGMTLADRR
jgi:hypothetical protein